MDQRTEKRVTYIVFAILFIVLYAKANEQEYEVTQWGDISSQMQSPPSGVSQLFTYRRVSLYPYKMGNLTSSRHYGPVSILFSPMTIMSYGNFKDPVKMKLGLITHFEIDLWQGGVIDVQYAFPFFNEIDSSLTPFPQLATMRHLMKIPTLGYLGLSGGIFTNKRWGFDIAWDRLTNKMNLKFSANIGVTGYSQFKDSSFNYTSLDRVTGKLGVTYYTVKFRMMSALSLGRFLEKDWGGTIEVRRLFHFAQIYLFFTLTDLSHNGGAGFVVPLWKRSYPSLRGLKIGPYRNFNWRYRYVSVHPPGNDYKTGCQLDNYLFELHPFLKAKNKEISTQ